jgi:predicted nucleic acid-binding Zn ribbon protein
MTARAEQRTCPSCGTPFTWTPAAPRQKFCSTRCKHRWHDARKRDRRRNPGLARAGTHPPAPPTPVDATTTAVEPATAGGLAATPACPHCRQPIALVAWLVPPAASITTPPRHAETILVNQQPGV